MRIGRRVEKARDQAVEICPGGLLGRHELERLRHCLKSWIEASVLFSIMSTTRQSAHICSRRVPSLNIECAPSLPSMLSIIWRVAKGLAQRTQLKGSASLSVTGSLAALATDSLGTSVMAFSGQVCTHRPHCTQLRSMKRSAGDSVASISADAGQAPTQALHSVQVCLLT